MKQQRDSQGRFKSKGIQKTSLSIFADKNNAIVQIGFKQDEVIDELNALKAWKEKQEEKESEENAKKVAQSWKEEEEYRKEIRKDKKEQLGDILYQWKWGEEWEKSKSVIFIRDEIIELLK